jgi:hypothetical protein
MYVEADIHQIKCKLLVDTGATVSIVSNDIYQKIPEVARPTLTSTNLFAELSTAPLIIISL